MRTLALACLAAACLTAEPGLMESKRSKGDFALTADPNAPHWKAAKPVTAGDSTTGQPVPKHRTEIRSMWTDKNLYFLFTCEYDQLFGNANPSTATETNKLWEHDAAEVFIGWDFNTITQYKEFQVSPQGEWVDLDIDRVKPLPEGGWRWNSGFKVKARIDEKNKVWYGEMQIPWTTIEQRPVKSGNELRLNLYRFQGPPPRVQIAWQPVGKNNHTPEKFGLLRLVD